MSRGAEDFERVVEPLIAPLRRFCERMLGDRQEAEDATQQALFKAYRAWGSFAGRSSRRTWLFRIAANACVRVLERRRGRDELPAEPEAPSDGADPPTVLAASEDERRVREALEALAPAQRMVLVLFCLEDLTHAEIAGLLGCSEGTAWSRLHRARRAFADVLRRRGLDGEVTP